MKRTSLLFLLLAVFACRPDRLAPEPEWTGLNLSGDWAVTAVDNGSGLVAKGITEIFSFDGKGAYSVSTGGPAIFETGVLDALKTDFSPSGASYECVVAGDLYRFGTIDATLSATRVSSVGYTFECSWDEGKDGPGRLRLEKIRYYKDEDPGTEDDYSFRLNGTAIIEGNDLVGIITDADSGRGIPGVVVSDGYSCTSTDANGVYQFKANPLARMVFYSTPSEYQVNLENSASCIPRFYNELSFDENLSFCRNDFMLTPLPGGKETDWTFVGVGDPQCANSSDVSRFADETIKDMSAFLENYSNVYAMTMGDIIFDSNNVWASSRKAMADLRVGGKTIPFFQVIGNHDHDATVADPNPYTTVATYMKNMGPVDYSYNRGDVHIVAMDNVEVNGVGTSTHSNNYTCKYTHGLSDEQIEWLRQDLSLVGDKENKMIIICSHMPYRDHYDHNFDKLYEMVKGFREVHFMTGHTHYHHNRIFANYNALGGQPYYDHVHGAACGAWWSTDNVTGRNSNITTSGGYSGYTVYSIHGPSIVDRVLKGTGRDAERQMRVYDANQEFSGSKNYAMRWSSTSNVGGTSSIACPGNPLLTGCFLAEVFDDDPKNWKVEFWQDGKKVGDFTRLSDTGTSNIAVCAYFFNNCGKNSTSYSKQVAAHIWYFAPPSGIPAAEKNWEVRAIFVHPGSGNTHVYKENKLTTDYSDFTL